MIFKRDWDRFKRRLMLFDAAATGVCFLGAYAFREASLGDTPPVAAYVALLPVIAPLWVFLLALFGAYQSPITTPFPRMARATLAAVAVGILHLILIVFALKLHFVSRVIVFVFAVTDAALLLAVRAWLRHRLHRFPAFRRRILVVGTGARAKRAAAAVGEAQRYGYEIAGYIDVAVPRAVGASGPLAFVGTVGMITEVLKENVIDEIVLAVPRSMMDRMENVVVAAETEGVRLRVMADLFPSAPKRLSLDECGAVPFLTFDWVAYDEWKVAAKRVIDFVLAGAALLVLAPLLLLVALAIKLDSAGPVLFVQTRVGRNKRTFRLAKFRTMCADAERRQADLEALNEAQGPVFKIANDPRVTRVGRVLRRTSLDELPQLWNVVRGDMSLVGPRPLPLRDVSRFDQAVQRKRFSVKPGITCLWQISGRSKLGFAEWLHLDLWYIDNWSLTLDLKVLIQTVPAVLRGTGAV